MNQVEPTENAFLESAIQQWSSRGHLTEDEMSSLRQEVPKIIAHYQSDSQMSSRSIEELTQKAIEEWTENSVRNNPSAIEALKSQGLGFLLE